MATETEAPRPGLWTRRTAPVVLGVLGLMTFIAFESLAITTALPVVTRDLGAEQWYALAFSATIATGLIGVTAGGTWADRRGVAQPLAIGGLLFAIGIASCVLAPNMTVFVAGRVLQGIGGGIDSVIVYVVIARFLPESARSRMFGLLVGAWLVPSIAGPLLTGALIELIHWRAVFAVVLAGSVVFLVCLLVVVREDPAGGRRGSDSPRGGERRHRVVRPRPGRFAGRGSSTPHSHATMTGG